MRKISGTNRRACPKCRGVMEDTYLPPKVPLAHCPSCNGLWIKHGRLKELLGGQVSERSGQQSLRVGGVQSNQLCPDCDVRLIRRGFPQGSGIIIAQCTQCSGTFLEAGSLDRMRDYVASKQQTGPQKH